MPKVTGWNTRRVTFLCGRSANHPSHVEKLSCTCNNHLVLIMMTLTFMNKVMICSDGI